MAEKKIKVPLYYGDFIMIRTNNFKKVERKYKLNCHGLAAFAFRYEKRNGYSRWYLVAPEKPSGDLIAHEALHIVSMIFNDRNIEMSTNNEEPQCYLLGWVFKQCAKFYKIK